MAQRDIYLGSEIGNYCIERKIASGSFGTVYLARHIHLKERIVVIKILHTVHLDSDEAKETFLYEAQILERLRGLPNILPLIDVGIDDDVPYMISEYAEQGSLRMCMRERGCPLPLEEALAIVSQVGKGLQEAHDKGVVHRDLKPENILFNAKGEALLADFGISTVLSTVSIKHTEVAGTPAYMAPEQFRGKVCKESDQYSLACITYELLTGHKPFEAPDFLSMGYCHAHEVPTSPRQLNPQLPVSVEQALLKALSKERAERYPSVSAFVVALNACDDQPLSETEDSVPSEPQPLTVPQLSGSSSSTSLPQPPVEQVSQPEAPPQLEASVSAPTHTKSVATQIPDVPLPQKRRPSRKSSLLKWGSLITIITILLAALIGYLRFQPVPPPNNNLGIRVEPVDGEDIGISDGRYALDMDATRVNKDAIDLKKDASESLRNGHPDQAIATWNQAHQKDTRDAEPLIYAEDQRVLQSGSPYISVVLGVSLGANVYDGYSRDILQGAYILQKECNENPHLSGGKKLRLLIARSGSNPDRVEDIAKQVVQAAQFDKTIVGVQGWSDSQMTLKAIKILADAHLPVVASNGTTDELTGISPYFFRTAVPNKNQTTLITKYIEKQLKPKRLVIFRDSYETYSHTLSDDLYQQFVTHEYYHIASIEEFQTVKDAQGGQLARHIQQVLKNYNPDLIFIATNAVGDIETLLKTIPATAQYANLKVFSSGTAYEFVQYDPKPNGYTRLVFSVSAYPDEWSILAPGNQEPPFFKDYSEVYSPDGQHLGVYGYSRANYTVMLTYDALSAILAANKLAIQQGEPNPTSEDIKDVLSQINGSWSFQGVSGAISFDPDGNPINKVRLIIRVVEGGYNHVAAYQGCFLIDSRNCEDDTVHILE